MKRQVKEIVLILLTVSIVVFVLGYFQFLVMSSVRAYVRGEGMWAKAQKDAVIQLNDYLHRPDEQTYLKIARNLQVNLQDQRARLSLQQHTPDKNNARLGFLAAGNHPKDVDNMITLFLWFEDIHHMKLAIQIWEEADRRIAELIDLANRIRTEHRTNPNADLLQYKQELDQLNQKLNDLETEFSLVLSEGAHWLTDTFLLINLIVLSAMLLFASRIARRVMGEIDQTERELRDSESRFRTLYDSNIIGILIWGNDGELYDGNDTFLRTLGYTREDLETGNLNWRDMTPEGSRAADERAMQQIANQGYCTPFNKDFYHKSGKPVSVKVGGALIGGSENRGVAFMVDRTHEKEMEDQLRLSATVLDASRDGVLICDKDRVILTANEAFCHISGFSSRKLKGETARFYDSENEEESKTIEASLAEHDYWQGDTSLTLADGSRLPVRASISAVRNNSGQINNYVAVFSDISARKALERDLKNMAHYDQLTGLANRSLFSDRLDTAISRAQRNRQLCALLFVDLDKFKPVNDQYGHAIGDELLKLVAKRLRTITRDSDTIGRLGGDEFVMILEGLAHENAVKPIAEKILEQLFEPFLVGDLSISIGCSIGIAIYPQHGHSGIALTRAADIAMYTAKAADDTHYYVYLSRPDNQSN